MVRLLYVKKHRLECKKFGSIKEAYHFWLKHCATIRDWMYYLWITHSLPCFVKNEQTMTAVVRNFSKFDVIEALDK